MVVNSARGHVTRDYFTLQFGASYTTACAVTYTILRVIATIYL